MKPITDLKVKAYFDSLPDASRDLLLQLRTLIFEMVPHIKEKMGYGIPSYYLKHPIIHIAAFKAHVGIYPGSDAIVHFADELLPYKTSEGTIRIPFSEPLPFDIVKKIIHFNIERE